MKIIGISHPIPTEYAKRIYEDKKTVFVCKPYLSKVPIGGKFILYESHGAKAYTGWANIKSIGKENTNVILNKYHNKLMLTPDEFKEYVQGRKFMTVIELEDFEKFKKPVKPYRFVTVGGKYIKQDEFESIKKNRE